MTSPPLRLAVDVGPLYGHVTGVGVATKGLVEELAHDERVVLDPYVVSSRARLRPGHRRLPLPGIVASHLWSRSDRPSADRWLTGADVVHGTNYVAPPSSRPTVISVYDCWFLEHDELATPLVRRAGKRLRRAVAHGAWVHASSDATAERVRRVLGTDRVRTVLLGPPDRSDVSAQPRSDVELAGQKFVLAIGTEEHRKNLTTLVAAFGVMTDDAGLHLVIAGATADQSKAIDESILRLPAATQARVHRLGAVTEQVKRNLLDKAAVLAYPSLDEGFGFPILEAQAAGVPIVAADVGSIAEIAGEGVALVDVDDPQAFADRLASVAESGVERLTLITAGHGNLRRFSWKATADGLVDIYRCAVETS